MTATTEDRYTKQPISGIFEKLQVGVDAGATAIPEGVMVTTLTATGMAVNAGTASAGPVQGVSEQAVDASGDSSDGDHSIYLLQGAFWFANSAGGDEITEADFLQKCYVVDNQTVSKTNASNTRDIAGVVLRVDATLGVLVYIVGALNEALKTADSDLASLLASTSNGEGASLVGVEDAAGNFTGATVEAVLAEIMSLLASVSNGEGASLVGIEDAGGIITATDVEGALAENRTALDLVTAALGSLTPFQLATGTLVAGTVTIGTGIVVTANTTAICVATTAITGSTNVGCLAHIIASNVVGGAGVGSVTINMLGNDGAIDTDAAGDIACLLIN